MDSGSTIEGRYLLERELGRGRTSVVYAGRDLLLDREVAVKVTRWRQYRSAAPRWLEQARRAAKLEHRGITEVFDLGLEYQTSYLVMPLLLGRTLAELLGEDPLPVRLVAELGLQAAQALAHGHKRGIVHGQLSRHKLMLVGGSAGLELKLLGFGLAMPPDTIVRPSVNRAAAPVDTHVAPELREGGAASPRSDLYSLGVLLYEAALGRPLVEIPDTMQGDVPPQFETLLRSLLANNPQRRPSDARELVELLEPFATSADFARELGEGALELGPELGDEVLQHETGETRKIMLQDTIGRDRELRAIDSRLTSARAGAMQMILVAGEAGIGKTTLLDELALACQQRELELLRTRATGHEAGGWMVPFGELLTAGLAQRPEAVEILARDAARLIALFPDLVRSRLGRLAQSPTRDGSWAGLERLPERGLAPARDKLRYRSHPDAVGLSPRDRLETVLVRAFGALVESGRPLTLAVDDAHLSAETVELFEVLFRRLNAAPLVVVLAYEPAELGPDHIIHALARRLAVHPRGLVLELEPLSMAVFDELLTQYVGSDEFSPGLAASLHHQSGGRPLHAGELVRAALDAKLLVQRDGVWRLETTEWPIPRQLSTSLTGRLRRLPARMLRALRMASVLAAATGSFEFPELLELCGYDDSELEYHLDEACQRSLLVEDRVANPRAYRFSSELLRRVVHDMLPKSARHKLHLHRAERLRRLPFSEELEAPREAQRLIHLLEGEAIAAARPQVVALAQQALDDGQQLERARAYITRLDAAEQTLASVERGELLLLLAELEHAREEDHAVGAALQRLITILDGSDEPRLHRLGERAAELARTIGRRDLGDRLLGLRPRDRRTAERQRRARAELAALRPATSSRSMQIGDLLLMHGEYTAAREAYDNARRRASREGDRDEEARQLQRLARVSSRLGHYETSIGYCRAGLELLAGRQSLERIGLWALAGYAHCVAGHFDRAEGELAAGAAELATFPEQRSPGRDRVVAELESSRGHLHMGVGQAEDAVRAFERCLSLSPQTDRWNLSVARFNLGQACAVAGQSSRALRELERSAIDARALGDRWGFARAQVARATATRDRGQIELGADMLAEVQDIADELSEPELFGLAHAEIGRHALLGGKLELAASEARRIKDMSRGTTASDLAKAHELLAGVALAGGELDDARRHANEAIASISGRDPEGLMVFALLDLVQASPAEERPELLARARAACEALANPFRELDLSLVSLRLGLGDPNHHVSDDYVALEQLSDRAEKLGAQRHVGLCLLAQAELLASVDLRGALDHARLGETQLRVLGAVLEAERAAELIAQLTQR